MKPPSAPTDRSSDVAPAVPPRTPGWLKLLVGIFAIVIVVGAGLFVSVASSALKASQDIDTPIDVVLHLGDPLATDANGRTNILLLGSGGKNWDEGTDLTDSMMVASVDAEAKRITLISIPRDLYVQVPGFGWSRLNYVWPYSVRHASGGKAIPDLPKTIFESITGLDIHYVMKVDFRGFTRVIDALGGIDLTIERSFTDFQYPTENFGFKTVSFDAGPAHLSGERALEFVRSRHAAGGEGSDIARSRRQQLIVQAVRERLLASNLLDDRTQLDAFVELVNEHYLTDLTLGQDLTLAKVAKNLPADGIVSLVISHEGKGALLAEPTEEEKATLYAGAAVLVPKGGTYEYIQRYIRRVLDDPSILLAPPRVVVLNGTSIVGRAATMGALIETENFEVVQTTNALDRARTETIVVDLKGTYAKEAQRIAGLVGGVTAPFPATETRPEDADLVVILGAP